MDNSNRPMMNRQSDPLGVNKMGKNIKKSPTHQPNFVNAARQQPQPQVYNINKNDFRSIVQQLTGSPLREPLPRPPQNPPKPPSSRLHRIRPPPLMPINRPPMPIHPPAPVPAPMVPPAMVAGAPNNNYVRPAPQYGQPLPSPPVLPPTSGDVWGNTAESPISVYMRYLQNSMTDPGMGQAQSQLQPRPPPQPQPQPQVQSLFQASGQNQPQPQAPGLLPSPPGPAIPSPRVNGPSLLPSPRENVPLPPLPLPRMHGPTPQLPSPRISGPPSLLPSPTSQFYLPSPTGFLNLLSPFSPYPFSPRYQHAPPQSPNFSFSPLPQSGILGSAPQFPPSPGYGFSLSPSGFFSISSPRWREQ